jgi:hypothetical protein
MEGWPVVVNPAFRWGKPSGDERAASNEINRPQAGRGLLAAGDVLLARATHWAFTVECSSFSFSKPSLARTPSSTLRVRPNEAARCGRRPVLAAFRREKAAQMQEKPRFCESWRGEEFPANYSLLKFIESRTARLYGMLPRAGIIMT